MMNNTQSCESDFMTWLSNRVSPAQLSELYWCYTEIESSCLRVKILKKPLFETTDYEVVQELQRYIEKNKYFHVMHRRQFSKLITAGRHYLAYTKEMSTKQSVSEKNVSEYADKREETKPAEKPVGLASDKKIETKDTKIAEIAEVVQKKAESPLVRTSEDERLLAKYPIIYKRVFFALQESFIREKVLSIGEIQELTQRIGRASDIEEILDNASWSKNVDGGYHFSDEIIVHDDETQVENKDFAEEITEQNEWTIDFNNLGNFVSTKPSSFTYFEENKGPCLSWTELYVSFFAALCEDYPYLFKPGMSFSVNGRRAELTVRGEAKSMHAPKDVPGTNYAIETNINASGIVRKIKYLLDFCSVDYENVVMKYCRKVPANEATDVAPRTAPPTPAKDFSYRNEPYEEVLKEKFRKGFRLDSAIELRKFRKFYANMHGMDVKEDDDEIICIIRRLCILLDGRAYHPDVMLSPSLKEKLLDYIEKCFNDGKTTIYYKALCTEFAEDFMDYPLYDNPDALKAYLRDVGHDKFYINRTYISKEANVTTDPLTEIRDCLKAFGRPVKYEELFTALPHLPQHQIKTLLTTNAEFVNNGHGAYFHESTVRLSDEELEKIASIIEQTIEERDFIGGNELYDEIKVMYPDIIEENSELSFYGFRDALKYKFGDRFSFKGNIINAAGKELSMADVFANYARKHDSFTLAELKTLAHELGSTTIYFEPVYENSLRISQEQFVSKYQAQFDVPEVDAAIDRICSGDYMAIKQVNNFYCFPYVGFPWNSFLLEHYVAAYSEKYTLLHARFNQTECAGAIVKCSADINCFDDFIVELLKTTDVELKPAPVLQMLVQEGYLVRKKYKNIEDLIIRAKAQRNRKETD